MGGSSSKNLFSIGRDKLRSDSFNQKTYSDFTQEVAGKVFPPPRNISHEGVLASRADGESADCGL